MALIKIPRKNPAINDLIEFLHTPYELVKGVSKTVNINEVWARLTSTELSVVKDEISKCILDRRYFLENYYTIKPEDGVIKTFYPFWDHQEIVYEAVVEEWDEKGCAKVIVLKPRQAGLSEFSVALVFHATIFTPSSFTMSIAQNPETAEQLFRKAQFAYDNLPWWLRPEIQYRDRGEYMEFQRVREDERLFNPGLASAIQMTHSAKGAGVAIGKTLRNAHLTEMSRWMNTEVMTTDIEPSMNAPDMLGIIESTALGRDGLYYEMWQEAVDGEGEWRPVFVPVYRIRKYSLPIKVKPFTLTEEENAVKTQVLADSNFSISDEFFNWRRRRVQSAIRRTGGPYTHYESYPIIAEEAFQNSGVCAFSRLCLDEQLKKHVRPPLAIGEITLRSDHDLHDISLTLHHSGDREYDQWIRKHAPKPKHENRLMIWEEPIPGETYYLGADVSDGSGADYSAAPVYKVGLGRSPDVQVAEWHGLINPSHYARVLAALGSYYNDCEIAVEYAKAGITTGDDLFRTLDYPNLFRWKHKDKVQNSLTSYVHWLTNQKTREDMINRMNEALLDKTIIIRSKYTLEEMRDFGKLGRDYKAEALSGNDDLCISNCICLAALRESYITLKHLDAGKPSHSPAQTPQMFAVYDHLNRQIPDAQFATEAEAKKCITDAEKKHNMNLSNWRVLPLMVCKANTIHSPALDSTGAEHELLNQWGINPRDQTPELVQTYRGVMAMARYVEGDDL